MKEVLQSSKNLTLIFLWFFVLHHSHSLKMCSRKKCPSLWQSPNNAPKPIDRYRWNSISGVLSKYPGLLFSISPLPLKLTIVHIRKEKKSDFLKNGINNFDEILWVYSSFDIQQYDTRGLSGFFRKKSMKLENYFLIYCPSSKHWPISFEFDIYCKYLQPVLLFSANP